MDIIGSLGVPLAVIALAMGVLATLIFFARNYKKVPPNLVLVIFGGKQNRFVTGGGVFIWPVINSVKELSLRVFQVDVKVENAPNKDGVSISVDAVANVQISSDQEILAGAAERLLDLKEEELERLCKTTLEGINRQIVGTLTVEEIVRDRERIQQSVVSSAHAELTKLGFALVNFVFTKVTDKEGYIEALGKKRTAEVKRDAAIGEADAKRESDEQSSTAKFAGEKAKLDNDAKTAEAQRDLDLKRAGFKQETETAAAVADMAKQLKTEELNRGLKERQIAVKETEVIANIRVAEQEVTRKERELEATVLKPAEAKKRADIITAEGEAQAKVLQADADKKVVVAKAEADKVRLASEGEGRATASAAEKREFGLAEATVTEAKGKADGASIEARVVAEALGLKKKNEALAEMSDAARLIVILDRLPQIIEELGAAGEKVVGSAFEHVGAGLSRIDNINIVDMGGGNGNGNSPVMRFAMTIPEIVFGVVQKARAMGVDLDELLKPLGVDVNKLVAQLGAAVHNTADGAAQKTSE